MVDEFPDEPERAQDITNNQSEGILRKLNELAEAHGLEIYDFIGELEYREGREAYNLVLMLDRLEKKEPFEIMARALNAKLSEQATNTKYETPSFELEGTCEEIVKAIKNAYPPRSRQPVRRR